MSLIGPVSFKPGPGAGAPELGDFITSIQRQTPAPVVLPGINKDFADVPKRGYSIALTGVEESLALGTLWRWLFDHRGEKDVPVTWATKSDGPVSWSGVIAVVPDPTQGGQANQHGTFTITITLSAAPTLVEVVPNWAANTRYELTAKAKVGAGVLEATVAGTSAAAAPALPATVGQTVVDGTVTWIRRS